MTKHRADHWDTLAERYERAYESPGRSGRFLRARRDAVVALLDADSGDLLEVGMGPGRVLAELAERGWRVSGVDPSERMVALARRRLPHARERLLPGTLERLPFPDARFDAVVACGVLGDVGWGAESLAELARAVRPGGLAVVTLPNRWSASRLLRHRLVYPAARAVKRIVQFGRPAPPRRAQPPARRRFEAMIESAGLALESRRYAGFSVARLDGWPVPVGSAPFRLVHALLARQLVYRARKPP